MDKGLFIIFIIFHAIIIYCMLYWILPDISKSVIGNNLFKQSQMFKRLENFVIWINTKF